jgi:hypothetical protein
MVSQHWDMRKYVMSDMISSKFEEFLTSVMTMKDIDKYLDGKKKVDDDLDFQYKLATAILMSGNEKFYTKVLVNDRILKAEVDIFLMLGCMRKLTGEVDIVLAYTKLDSAVKDKLVRGRLSEYEWMFRSK